MANRQRKKGRRSRPKSKKGNLSFSSLPVQLAMVFVIVLGVFFLIAAKIISNIVGALLCMLSLSILAYFIINSPKKNQRRRARRKKKVKEEPQFYTALPSTLGLTDIPEEFSTSEVKLPPRLTKSVRRQRDFVIYPLSVGGGDYSDSYIQVNKDTVLRLRGEMVPEMQSKFLPGNRIKSFPSTEELSFSMESYNSESIAVAAEPVAVAAEPVAVAAEPVAVAAEPVAVAAEPVAVAAEPVAVAAEPVKSSEEEESEDMDFDMEWD